MKKIIKILLILSFLGMVVGLSDFYEIILLTDEENLSFKLIYGDLWFIYTWGQLFISGIIFFGCFIALIESKKEK